MVRDGPRIDHAACRTQVVADPEIPARPLHGRDRIQRPRGPNYDLRIVLALGAPGGAIARDPLHGEPWRLQRRAALARTADLPGFGFDHSPSPGLEVSAVSAAAAGSAKPQLFHL